MKWIAGAVLISVLLFGGIAERRAYSCGAGWTFTDLGEDLRGDWFNGMFWIIDSDGWGVIAPPVELQLEDQKRLLVRSVNRYAKLSDALIVDVESDSNVSAVVLLDHKSGSARANGTPTISSYVDKSALQDQEWVSVRPASCLFGLFWPVRVLVLVIIVWMLRIWLTTRNKGS